MDYNLCDYKSLVKLLSPYGFNFSKSLGQNFIIDSSVCPTMVEMLGTDKNTGVLEKTLGDYDNFELVKGDCMKLDLAEILKEKLSGFDTVKVCANLPYYITSPVIMNLLESRLPISEIEVMVQQEAAERLCAEIGTRAAGAVSVAVKYYGESEILFNVGRECFMPSPKVDSSVIKIRLYDEPKYTVKNEKKFFSLVKGIFAQRRKTLVNSLSNSVGMSKAEIQNALSKMGLEPTVRAENLTMEEIVALSDLLLK